MNPVEAGAGGEGAEEDAGESGSVNRGPVGRGSAEGGSTSEGARTSSRGPSSWRGSSGLRLKQGVINFLAIFLGVSLSFLAEDWREDLNEVEDGLRSLQGILADIEQDLPAARNLARTDSTAVSWGLWLHRNWERSSLPTDSVDAALQALHTGAPYTPVRSEYESAKYAGRLQYIENQDLRQEITELYESSQPFIVHLYDLRTEFTLEVWRLLRPYESYQTTFSGGGTVPAVHLEAEWSELRSNTSLRNAVVESIGLRRAFSNVLRGHVAQSLGLRESILRELGGDDGESEEDGGGNPS